MNEHLTSRVIVFELKDVNKQLVNKVIHQIIQHAQLTRKKIENLAKYILAYIFIIYLTCS